MLDLEDGWLGMWDTTPEEEKELTEYMERRRLAWIAALPPFERPSWTRRVWVSIWKGLSWIE